MTDEPAPRLRIAFLGTETSAMSIALLERLAAIPEVNVTAVTSRPPAPSARRAVAKAFAHDGVAGVLSGCLRVGRQCIRSAWLRGRWVARTVGFPVSGFASVSELARAKGLAQLSLPPMRSPASVEALRVLRPDLILVGAFSQILRPNVLEIPRLGCVNLHPSLLPAYRGPNPFYWVLMRGEQKTGVTFHRMDEGIDTGAILLQGELPIGKGDDERMLEGRAIATAASLLPELIAHLRAGTIFERPQTENGASYFPAPPPGASRL